MLLVLAVLYLALLSICYDAGMSNSLPIAKYIRKHSLFIALMLLFATLFVIAKG